jgi:class 3 adenylate cyclase
MTGDGMLATFDGPGRAIRCAIALGDAVRPLGLELRAGLHTGEVEVRGTDIAASASTSPPGFSPVRRLVIYWSPPPCQCS